MKKIVFGLITFVPHRTIKKIHTWFGTSMHLRTEIIENIYFDYLTPERGFLSLQLPFFGLNKLGNLISQVLKELESWNFAHTCTGGCKKKCYTLNFAVFRRFLLRKWHSDVLSTTIRFVFEFCVDWWYFCPTIMKISLSPLKNDEFFDKMLGQFTIVIWPQIKVGKYIKREN